MRETFKAHYRPTKTEFDALWAKATFAFDANVLLNVYRYSSSTRDALLKVMEDLQDRLWLPHQAGLEFHRNRPEVIERQSRDFEDHYRALVKEIDDLKRHPYPAAEKIEATSTPLLAILKKAKEEYPNLWEDDPLRTRLDKLFQGRIGPTDADPAAREKEAAARLDAKRPPGYMDVGKEGARKLGDAILWLQVLDWGRQGHSVILVTDERKEDWWLKVGEKTVGPRRELLEEYTKETQHGFYMYSSDGFLEAAKARTKAKPSQEAIEEVRRRHEADDRAALLGSSDLFDIPSRVFPETRPVSSKRLRKLLLAHAQREGGFLGEADIKGFRDSWGEGNYSNARDTLVRIGYISPELRTKLGPDGQHRAQIGTVLTKEGRSFATRLRLAE